MMKIMRVIMIRHELKNPNQIVSMKWIIMMLNIMAKIIQGKNIRKIKPTFVNFWQDLWSTTV